MLSNAQAAVRITPYSAVKIIVDKLNQGGAELQLTRGKRITMKLLSEWHDAFVLDALGVEYLGDRSYKYYGIAVKERIIFVFAL